VFGAVYEKRAEPDDSAVFTQSPQGTVAIGGPFTHENAEGDDYLLLHVTPLSRKPLIVVRNVAGLLNRNDAYLWIWMPAMMIKAGIFQFDAEGGWLWGNMHQRLPDSGDEARDWVINQWRVWAEAGLHPGPFSFVLGGFYVQGTASKDQPVGILTTGAEFEPLLLLFSEDMGLLWNSSGVFNNSGVSQAGWNGRSGYKSGYFRAAYKINDTMKLRGIVGFLWADKMCYGRYNVSGSGRGSEKWKTPDTFLGWEVDLGFEWNFMDNISYVAEAGFFKPGPYWNGAWGFNGDRDVFGMRHMLVINW